ncbi:Glycosyl transferase family 2 [anaerobic digester metagenome]
MKYCKDLQADYFVDLSPKITVSVIVLTYNHEDYIAQALDSILMQEVDFDYEILVGDDASSDLTVGIIREYVNRFPSLIRPFFRAINLGAPRNAYELLRNARGDYLAFCEGDDFWTSKDKLLTQVKFLERNPSLIGCSHRCKIVDENGEAIKNQKLSWVKEKERFTLDDFQGIYLPGQTATIVKRNIFKNCTDDYSFLYRANQNISDRTSTLLYLTKGAFGFIPRTMSAYRRASSGNGTSITDLLYTRNPNRLFLEVEYTERLEEIAKVLTDQRDVFTAYYKQLYATAVYHFIKKPSCANKELVIRTAGHIGNGLFHPLSFGYGVFQKILHCKS